MRSVLERAPVSTVGYFAFVDPSGGSSDSMTLAIGHRELGGTIVLDCIRERRAPFSPDAVVSDFVDALRSYRALTVYGDRYGGEWPRERFSKYGITYYSCNAVKSDLYLHALPMIMAGKVDLLDNQRLIGQLCGLERRAGRGGRDTVDHRSGAHDDVANACAGVIYVARPPVHDTIVEPIFVRAPRTYFGDIGAGYMDAPHLDASKRSWPTW